MGQSGIHHNEHERSLITSTLERPPLADLAFQGHFHAPPAPAPYDSQAAPSPSLEGKRITHEDTPPCYCPRGRWLLGICVAHGNERWIYRPCKRRDCPVCGVKRRKRVAWRIAHGIEILGGEHGAGWFVGTWPKDVEKSAAVRAVARFVARLRRNFPHPLEYACTWETTARGRLHVNLIFAPWTYTHSTTLARYWQDVGGGPNIWIKRVGEGIGQEAAKSREDAGYYFSKREQMVRTGRAANYSKGWPKLPETEATVRKGEIEYIREHDRMPWQLPPAFDPADVQLHLWQQTYENEYRRQSEPLCQCFQHVLPIEDSNAREPPS